MLSKKISWKSNEVSKIYVKSIEPTSDNEINLTKKLYHDPYFFSLIPNLTGQGILDIGCGNGYMLRELELQNTKCELIGTDFENMLDEVNLHPDSNIKYVPADSRKLPFPNEAFDIVISSLMFHWVDDIQSIAKEIYRILKKDGHFIVSNINPKTFHVGEWKNMDTEKPEYVVNKDISEEQQLEVYLNKTFGPLTYYMRPVSIYKQIFEENGFRNIKIHEPLLENTKILNEHPKLNKYKFHPLYLFTTGIK